jgi:hypothetical protein
MLSKPDRIRLAYETLTIDVGADEQATLAWLIEFLAPAFQAVPSDPSLADHLVLFETTPTRYAKLRDALGAASPQTLDGFTYDGRFSRHPGWVADDGRIWVHDERHDTFYGVDDAARSVFVVAGHPGPYPRVALMRVVRELATIALHRSDRLPVHGAAFVHDGTAVLLCGPKRSGKTSLLIHALRCGGAFISNDRLFVSTEAPVAARSMPTIVMLRNDTLDRFEQLKEAFEAARFDRGRTIAECAPGIARPEPRAARDFDRPGISPAQLCHLLGVPMQPAAPVGTLLLPRVDQNVDGILIEALPASLAQQALEKSLLKPSHPTRYSQVFAPGSGGEEVSAEAERCRRLVEQVPVYACRLGPNAFQTDIGEALGQAPSPEISAQNRS